MALYEVTHFPFGYYERADTLGWTYNPEVALKHVRKHAAMVGYSIVISEPKHMSRFVRDSDGEIRYIIDECIPEMPMRKSNARAAFGTSWWLT